MSDGTNSIYFYEPEDFKQKRKIEVWDNKNPVPSLNELEAVEGNIWANKYQTDTLVKIDPITGKVLAYADLSGILKDEDRKGEEDVLNGIAYNAEEKLYYVTGKNWPKSFAIRLVKRKSI
jgi:glutamine cyclotransferase